MEGFAVVLLISWLILIGCFIAMYFMDEATKRAAERRSKTVQEPEAPAPRPTAPRPTTSKRR